MSDTVFPYDDEVADPYAADDTKNPHEESGEPAEDKEETAEKPAPKPARRAVKATKKK